MFDYMIKAFNFSERYRIPAVVLSDAYLAGLKGKVVIPAADKIDIEPRRYFGGPTDSYLPYKRDKDYVPRMVDIGKGYRFHVTGLTHDDRGYPIMFEECQEYNVHPLMWKIRNYVDDIVEFDEYKVDDADVVVLCYGVTGRAARAAVDKARAAGVKAGLFKLITVWPFPEKRIAALAKKVKAFVVPEMNFGQIVSEVERCSYGEANVFFVSHGDRGMDNHEEILSAIQEASHTQEAKSGVVEYRGA
jgi:2-oxoglutarate ferredoxin oxidoreductase subunit alpha